MPNLLAMVGFAEGVVETSIWLGYLTYVLIGILAALGLLTPWRLPSRVLVYTALAVVALDAYFYKPWLAFGSMVSDDPDVVDLMHASRRLAYFWLSTTMLLLFAILRVEWFPKLFIVRPESVEDTVWESK